MSNFIENQYIILCERFPKMRFAEVFVVENH